MADDPRLVPVGPLTELIDRLEATADTTGGPHLSGEAQFERSAAYEAAAGQLRDVINRHGVEAPAVAEVEQLRVENEGLRADLQEARR